LGFKHVFIVDIQKCRIGTGKVWKFYENFLQPFSIINIG